MTQRDVIKRRLLLSPFPEVKGYAMLYKAT